MPSVPTRLKVCGTPITEAFGELTSDAFALWIRLMFVPGKVLERGRRELSQHLNVPERTLDRRLAELRNKAYLRIVPPPSPGYPTKIEIVRRATIVGPNLFVRLT